MLSEPSWPMRSWTSRGGSMQMGRALTRDRTVTDAVYYICQSKGYRTVLAMIHSYYTSGIGGMVR